MLLAHIAGIPVEETALSLAPIAAATGGIAGMKLRERAARRRKRRARPQGRRR
jgi:predicted alpha/beta-hydrolase family hydrolase